MAAENTVDVTVLDRKLKITDPLTKFSCIFAALIHDAGNLIAMVLLCIDVYIVMCILNVYPLLIHFHQTTKEYQTLSSKGTPHNGK
jgi:hypothetical protein